jgi:hypothetical protein
MTESRFRLAPYSAPGGSQTIKRESLFRFILFGRRQVDHIFRELVDYYNTRRAHMVREHLPPVRSKPEDVIQIDCDQVVVPSCVGGLVKSYKRRAA